MVTVSHLVENIVNNRPTLYEAMSQGIISYGNLAEQIHAEIEEALGKKVKHSAIVMALRRHAEKMEKTFTPPKFDYSSEITMKTNLCDVAVQKSDSIVDKMNNLYALVSYERGDMMNIVHGNYEFTVVTNMKYLDKLKKELKGEKILNVEKDLVAISLTFNREFIHTPGVIAATVRQLKWENVNIFELISTMTELTFIISQKDSMKAYNALQSMVEDR